MSLAEPSGPDLVGVVRDANEVSLPFVVVGGFSVIANGYVRATNDSDLLVPDGVDANQAVLRSIIGFKRLAGRPRDKNDLEELEAFHGELPIDPIPGLDDES
jgi:hypothetical protein